MKLPSIVDASQSYETWLAKQIPLIKATIEYKHERMAEGAFPFLRATFYRWMQLWLDVCPEFDSLPRVWAVGDLHIENFGTWRDEDGRLIWGINDFDEVYPLPFVLDLVRLAVSSHLAVRNGAFSVDPADTVDALLLGYERSLEKKGQPFVLEEHNRWLRKIALNELRNPAVFWENIEMLPPARGSQLASAKQAMLRTFPLRGLKPKYLSRIAGLGSLGRTRIVALADCGGGYICREAKAIAPSACVWALERPGKVKPEVAEVVRRAIRVHDPFYTVEGKWIVRRLAPHCSKIDVSHLPKKRDELELLTAMGAETANVHLGSANAREIKRHLTPKLRKSLVAAIERMSELTLEDWRAWRQAHRRGLKA